MNTNAIIAILTGVLLLRGTLNRTMTPQQSATLGDMVASFPPTGVGHFDQDGNFIYPYANGLVTIRPDGLGTQVS